MDNEANIIENSADNLPAIVVVGYNRPKSLKRLLSSLKAANYPPDTDIPLVISLDYCNDQETTNSLEIVVSNFKWAYGKMETIRHPKKLGLKNHILFCGSLTERFETVIVLEDDLFLSNGFYNYTIASINFYGQDNRISGISLYSHQNNPYLRRSFQPLEDGSDIFFLQFASSWGQVWNKAQWTSFMRWFRQEHDVKSDDFLPDEVIAWPETSWLKFFIKYMVECEKFFVYPRVSLSTNFGDPGTHFSIEDSYYQVSILLRDKKYQFVPLNESLAVYDSFFELKPEVLNKLTDRFHGESYTVDLYGSKNRLKIQTQKLLTIQECFSAYYTFGDVMKPSILNIVNDIRGETFKFCDTSSLCNNKNTNLKQNNKPTFKKLQDKIRNYYKMLFKIKSVFKI